uniref:Putative secreted protein n=1 Tax=Ixodes ricinus TaxID=34613 RepID=A0A6B0UEI2_IXORI
MTFRRTSLLNFVFLWLSITSKMLLYFVSAWVRMRAMLQARAPGFQRPCQARALVQCKHCSGPHARARSIGCVWARAETKYSSS